MPEQSLSPQGRWRQWRARWPRLSRRQQRAYGLLVGLLALSFALFILPYLLPLGGPEARPLDELADPDGEFIDLNGVAHYVVRQPGPGPAVLLVHGFGGASVDWEFLRPYLTEYDLYALDLAGFGLSEKGLALDMSHAVQAERLRALLDHYGLREVHLVGHDMGGNIALHLAQTHPERVQSLALIAPALIYHPTTPIPEWALQTGFIQRWARVFIRWIMPASTEINLRSAAERDSIVTPALIKAYQRPYHTPDWDLALLALARDSSQSPLPRALQQTPTRTLVLWGAADGWIAPQTAEQIAEDLPQARRVLLPGTGHLPMLEAPELSAVVLLNYWAGF